MALTMWMCGNGLLVCCLCVRRVCQGRVGVCWLACPLHRQPVAVCSFLPLTVLAMLPVPCCSRYVRFGYVCVCLSQVPGYCGGAGGSPAIAGGGGSLQVRPWLHAQSALYMPLLCGCRCQLPLCAYEAITHVPLWSMATPCLHSSLHTSCPGRC
jgi:hypothetical protein